MKRPRLHASRIWLALLGVVASVLALSGWQRSGSATTPALPAASPPEPPAGGQTLPPGTDLQARLDAALADAVFYLAPGVYQGPLRVSKPVTLWGSRTAVIRSNGQGHTLDVQANGTRLLGFTVDGSGDRPDRMDAAVHVQGDDVTVRGLRILNAYFGLVGEKSRRMTLAGNEIVGDPAVPIGLRGDAIRLWETRDSLVADNRITDSRDVLVWYAPDNRIVNNVVSRGRYGTHFMYCDGGVVEGNRYRDNTVGVFVMYSRNVQVRGNQMAGAAAAGGMGLGVKESGNLTVENNRFVQDHVGLYLDNSPFRNGDSNRVAGNLFALCQTGVVFHSSPVRNRFIANAFRANQDQVRVDGRGNALETAWRGNAFDDYQGYDLDGDGWGDVPYESRSLSNQLIGRSPELAFFRGTPAFGLVEAVGQIFPLFQPEPIFVDPQPRMRAGNP
ncbi:MAG: nitrous oxide reductase family maturation protein NosD [Gemmataceae bacterium]